MTVFGNSGKKQVFSAVLDYETDVSQRFLEACLCNDLETVLEYINDPFVDVNFVGVVSVKMRMAEVICSSSDDESPNVVRFEYREMKSDVTALFVAVHNGNMTLVKKLLSHGADANQKLFRGFSLIAAVREDQIEIFEMLLKAGASQPACEEALLEASCHGRGGKLIKLLMDSDQIRPHIAVHALVTACCRGFTDVVDTILKCGVDLNAAARVLLQSSKHSLPTNIYCPTLVAAVVSRQVSIVRLLQMAFYWFGMDSEDEYSTGEEGELEKNGKDECKCSVLLLIIMLQVAKARDVGVNSIVLFPKVPDAYEPIGC